MVLEIYKQLKKKEKCYGNMVLEKNVMDFVVRDLNQCLSCEKTRHQTLDVNPSTRILLILTTSQSKRVPHKVDFKYKAVWKE